MESIKNHWWFFVRKQLILQFTWRLKLNIPVVFLHMLTFNVAMSGTTIPLLSLELNKQPLWCFFISFECWSESSLKVTGSSLVTLKIRRASHAGKKHHRLLWLTCVLSESFLKITQGVSLCDHQMVTATGTRRTMWSGRATLCWCASLPSWVTVWGAEEESVMFSASHPRKYVLPNRNHSFPGTCLCKALQLQCWSCKLAVSQSHNEFCFELWEISQYSPHLV